MVISALTANQNENKHQFCNKLGESETKTFEVMRQAYGKKAARCFEWHFGFKNGRTSLED